eukprot:6702556-Prorocentrum_lima.AAC.1
MTLRHFRRKGAANLALPRSACRGLRGGCRGFPRGSLLGGCQGFLQPLRGFHANMCQRLSRRL